VLGAAPEIGLDDARLSNIAAVVRAELVQEADAGLPCSMPGRVLAPCISFRRR